MFLQSRGVAAHVLHPDESLAGGACDVGVGGRISSIEMGILLPATVSSSIGSEPLHDKCFLNRLHPAYVLAIRDAKHDTESSVI